MARYQLLFRQSRSSSIALTSDDNRAVVVNRQKASVSVIRVRNTDGSDAAQLLAEIPVGREPRFVAIAPNDSRAYVTSAVDGTMSVIDLTASTPVALGGAIDVGVEPRGIAITPNGTYAFIAGHTTGDVAVVRLSNYEVVSRIHTGGNPYAIAISNDGDAIDSDERVYVTQLFGEVIDQARPDGFDDAKQGVVSSFRVGEAITNAGAGAAVTRLLLKPMLSGFNADRRNFCPQTRDALQTAGTVKYFNSGADGTLNGAAALAKPTFCPDVASANIDAAGPIGRVAQKTYPNMLFGALLRGPFLYVPNVGAQPEPPVNFNSNVQALVGVLSPVTNAETPFSVNLNTYVLKEPAPATPTASLDKLFLNDIVAIDADRRGKDFLVVSRGGNYVIRASIGTDGKLTTLDANNTARRFQTGNLPSGVVMARTGLRAYVNNELNTSMSALNLADNTVIARDIESSAPPAPGTQAHRNLVGKLAFFTALGIPDKLDTTGDGQFDVALRDINPLGQSRQGVEQRLVGLRLVPRRWPLRQRHVDLRDRPAPDHSARRHFRAQQPRRSAHPQLERGARFEHGLQQQRTRHPGRYRLRDQCRRRRQDRAGVQSRADAWHQRFARRHERVGGHGSRAHHAGRCREYRSQRACGVHHQLRELPWWREVDQEPHRWPVPGQPAAAGGSGRPGVLHRWSAQERRGRRTRRPAGS